MTNRYLRNTMLLTILTPTFFFTACTKATETTPKKSNLTSEVSSSELSRSFPEIGLSFSYYPPEPGDTSSSSKVDVSGDYIFVDNNVTFYAPESTAYFTTKCQHKKDSSLQYFLNGKYHADTKKLELYYVKVDTAKK